MDEWKKSGQRLIFEQMQLLETHECDTVVQQMKSIDIDTVKMGFESFLSEEIKEEGEIIPIDTLKLKNLTKQEQDNYLQDGLDSFRNGNAAILVFAGGQGTRLGSNLPKGMYDVGLPSGKSLYQIQIERLLRLQELCGEDVVIPFFVLASLSTIDETNQFLKSNDYFGLEESQVTVFKQGNFPILNEEGQVVLKDRSNIAMAPNGNGGGWIALKDEGILDFMDDKGIEWLCAYPIDNILVKVGDPLFLGASIASNCDIVAKVVPKAYPTERVGVLAIKNGKHTVLEYSEIDEERRVATAENGDLLFSAANMGIFNFSVQFLKKYCNNYLHKMPFHKATKLTEYLDSNMNPISGPLVKLEYFNFDCFEEASSMLAFETVRAEEFSPLKNSDRAEKDNPKSCREHISSLHKKYIIDAGGKITGEGLCEISPLVSYAGENLEQLSGQEIHLPYYLNEL
eukprot:TRINITY_DN8113_c0_g1_i1.p1 TRINITY_DN8113_c0_g1~~TRINITY_DN8113_c0_g1_i1.p1  ORF type:complete len:464 (+),score=126.65 TRINITY_DN8113_c0_g1_i1:29-1393(+)